MTNFNNKTIWNNCLESIKVSVSSANFTTWFSQTHLVSLEQNNERCVAEIGCPSTFIKASIESRYFGLIQDSLSKTLNIPCDLLFVVKENLNNLPTKGDSLQPLFDNNKPLEDIDLRWSRLRPSYSFKDFAVSASNQMAWAAADAVSKNPGNSYNPLFVWGGVGVGKTHLMNAIGLEIIKADVNKKVYLCSGEEFTNDIVEGIRNKTTQAFRNKYRKLDALFIDDIQFIAGKDAVQVEFFHTFNALVAAGGQIVLTSDKPPSEISKLEERLRSRFEAGLIIDIAPPDFELRCAITQIKAKQRALDISMDLVQIIASNLDSARKIEGFLVKLSTQTTLKNLDFSEELVKSLLSKGDETKSPKKVDPDTITQVVCNYYSVGKRAIMGQSKMKVFALPRQVLMYLLRTQTGIPLKEIGRIVGGRDHTTVMHAVNKITSLASEDVNIREDLEGIKQKL